MIDPTPPNERLRELLAEQALFGLGAEELGELHNLTAGRPEEFDDLALAAAALDLAHHNTAGAGQQLPEHLRRRTLEAVRRAANEPPSKPVVAVASLTIPGSIERQASGGVHGRELFAWFSAAAALLVMAFFVNQQPSIDASAEQLRAELMDLRQRGDADVMQIAWTPSDTDAAAKGAAGEVLWSDKLNRGVMVFQGLAANDPKTNQYQLWIFDAKRDAAHPVDGGVFDIPAGAREVIVPIDARLPVAKATLFAVSVEPPGGVVVSDRARLPLTAAVEASED